MKTMKTQIQTIFFADKNEQFLCYNNYIISVISNPLRLNFYNMKNLDIDFQIKGAQINNFYQYKIWKLFKTSDNQLYVIRQETFEPRFWIFNLNDDKEFKRLGIFHLKINERIIEEKAKFNYYNYYEDLNNEAITANVLI